MLIKLRASDGSYVSHRGATAPMVTTRTPGDPVELILDWPSANRPRSGDRCNLFSVTWNIFPTTDLQASTFDPDNRRGDTLWLKPRGTLSTPDHNIEIRRIDHNGAELADGHRIALRCLDAPHPGWLSAESSGSIRVIPVDSPGARQIFTVEVTSDLKLFWNQAALDNGSVATSLAEREQRAAGGILVRSQGRVFLNPAVGLQPLTLFWHAGFRDNLVTAVDEGQRDAVAAGYRKVRVEGWIFEKPLPGTVPLRTYWRGSDRQDTFTTTLIEEEQKAATDHYQFLREEGFLLPPIAAPAAAPAPAPGIPVATPANPAVNPTTRPITGPGGISVTIPAGGLINFTQPRHRRTSNKKALILSGGGAKGCFEVGAAKRLWEQGYRPDIICGVSVGALNAAKLAEGRPTSATELETAWQSLRPPALGGAGDRAVYLKEYFLNLLGGWVKNMIVDGIDDGIGAIGQWLTYAAAHFHAIHLMQPLRDMIHRNLNVDAVRQSGIKLRVGVTDLRSGQFFSVTEPIAASTDHGLNRCGRIDPEPDHRIGDSWLNRPIFGSDTYAMSLEDAIYSSCTLPVFMDPKILNLRNSTPITLGEERLTLLKLPFLVVAPPGAPAGPLPVDPVNSTYSASGIAHLLRLTRNGTRPIDGTLFNDLKNAPPPNYAMKGVVDRSDDPDRGDARSAEHHLFDGGLRDTMAIRTAIRLGAREIIVITGDRLQSAPWSFKNPGTLASDLFALPVAQYLFGLIGIWVNEAARTDLLLAVAQNEFLGWLYRCYSLLDAPKRRQIAGEFNQYWAEHGTILRNVLGGATWLGGDTAQAYGTPFLDEGCCIKFVMPSRDIIGAMEFDNWSGFTEGIQLGYEAAQNPVVLSFPVPSSLIES